MKVKTLEHWKELLQKMLYHNRLAPFPIYDTDYVLEIKDKIKVMELKNKYDEDPVDACSDCKSLNLRYGDTNDNDIICMRCGSINNIIKFETIYKYEEFIESRK